MQFTLRSWSASQHLHACMSSSHHSCPSFLALLALTTTAMAQLTVCLRLHCSIKLIPLAMMAVDNIPSFQPRKIKLHRSWPCLASTSNTSHSQDPSVPNHHDTLTTEDNCTGTSSVPGSGSKGHSPIQFSTVARSHIVKKWGVMSSRLTAANLFHRKVCVHVTTATKIWSTRPAVNVFVLVTTQVISSSTVGLSDQTTSTAHSNPTTCSSPSDLNLITY